MHEEPVLIELPQRGRKELPRWTVRLSGVDIGVIETVRIGGSRTTFYRARAALPGWEDLVDLELHPDRELQARKLVEFHEHPEEFQRHLSFEARKFLFGST